MANNIRPLDERVHKQVTLLREVDSDQNLTDLERAERKEAIYQEYAKQRQERDRLYKENELDTRRDEVQRQAQDAQQKPSASRVKDAKPIVERKAVYDAFAQSDMTSGLSIRANPAQVEVIRSFALGQPVAGQHYVERTRLEVPHEGSAWYMRNAKDRAMHLAANEELKRDRAKEYHTRTLESSDFILANPAPYTHIGADFNTDLLAALIRYNSVLQDAEVRTRDTGEPVFLPNVNDATHQGALIAENGDIANGAEDPDFSTTRIDIYKYTSRIVLVSLEALNDVRYDLGNELAELLGIRIGRAVGAHFATGSGSGQPHGIFTAAPAITTTATQAQITYAEILDLFNGLEIAYRVGAK